MKFINLIQCITAGEIIVVYHRKAFQQEEPGIYWGNVSGCYADLHRYFDCLISLQTYKGTLCIILEDDPA